VKSQLKSFGFAQDNDLGINTITRKNLKEALAMLNSNTDLQKKLVDSSLIEVDAQLNTLKGEYAQIQSEKPDDKRLEPLSRQIEALTAVRDGNLNAKQKLDDALREQLAKGAGQPDEAKAFKRISTLRTGIARLESALETGGDTALGALMKSDPTLAKYFAEGEPPESVQDAIDQLQKEIEFNKQFLSEDTLRKYFTEETPEGEAKFLGIDENTGKEVWSIPGDPENVELR